MTKENEEKVIQSIRQVLCRMYMQHRGNRATYEEAVVAQADQLLMPPDIKETFLKLALSVYDETESK